MAYSVDVAPGAKDTLLALSPKEQRLVIDHLEVEAGNAAPEGEKTKRLRRTQVNGFRIVFLELHDMQKIMLLKIADFGDLHRRFDPEAKPAPRKTAVSTPEPPGTASDSVDHTDDVPEQSSAQQTTANNIQNDTFGETAETRADSASTADNTPSSPQTFVSSQATQQTETQSAEAAHSVGSGAHAESGQAAPENNAEEAPRIVLPGDEESDEDVEGETKRPHPFDS